MYNSNLIRHKSSAHDKVRYACNPSTKFYTSKGIHSFIDDSGFILTRKRTFFGNLTFAMILTFKSKLQQIIKTILMRSLA